MTDEMNKKLDLLLDSIKKSLVDIKREGRKARELKKAVQESRDIVTEVLEQQLGGVSLEEQINISEIPDEDWLITAKHIIAEINDPFVPKNQYEIYFLQLCNYLRNTNKETLLSNLIFSLNKMMQEEPDKYDALCNVFVKFPFWDSFNPEDEDYSTFELRISILKQHSYDLLWLYRNTADYLSKRTLAAILMNWLDLQTNALISVRSIFKNYCEPDIFPDNKEDVYVDLGAYIGNSIADYVQVYGKDYKKIYAFEPAKAVYDNLCETINDLDLHDIEIIQKGVGAQKGKKYIQENYYEYSYSRLIENGDISEQVDVVRLDDELKEYPTYLKVNVCGSEKEAITGCKKIITKSSPKIAINICYDYDNIWRIPSIIEEYNSNYIFYLRHYGDCILPMDFVMFCRPN